MTKRRNLDREGLEVYLLHLLLAYRPLLRLSALLILVYAIFGLSLSPSGGGVALGVAIFLVLASYSYRITVTLAKVGAWLGTIGKKDR